MSESTGVFFCFLSSKNLVSPILAIQRFKPSTELALVYVAYSHWKKDQMCSINAVYSAF